MAEVIITGSNFESEVMKSKIPVILDFWATWCGPCRMMNPIMEEIANENEGKIKVGKVNVDENPDLARKFSIYAIPTMIGFDGGEIKGKIEGAVSKEKVLELVR